MHAAVGTLRPPSTAGRVRVGAGAALGVGAAEPVAVGALPAGSELALPVVAGAPVGRLGTSSLSRGRFGAGAGASAGRDGGVFEEGSGAGSGRSDCSSLRPSLHAAREMVSASSSCRRIPRSRMGQASSAWQGPAPRRPDPIQRHSLGTVWRGSARKLLFFWWLHLGQRWHNLCWLVLGGLPA